MRLIDLRCDWALQYAAESSQYDPAEYAEIPARLARLDGYLMGTSLAVLGSRRKPADWARQADPWHALGEMLAGYAAEFSGRLLHGPEDVARWRAEPQWGLCWGVLAVDGLDALIRTPADLDRLAGLFGRGVRLFGPVAGELGPAFLERLLELAPAGPGPRPALDLGGADARTVADVLDWFEADGARPQRLPLVHAAGDVDALGPDLVRRLRSLGATIGVSPRTSVEAFRGVVEGLAALPFRGRAGYEGIGVATDFLASDDVPPELDDVDKLVAWAVATFPVAGAPLLLAENARRLVLATAGAA
ncbi:Zn-dependent dipeptidase, microsomal dipeptidase [Paludisphaera mucosa]|uniref:Zn-dependent dipeptidase, microsomal dipeptidase n=1 Tax=Paludisphaera mucosa TaxID=3030827 RepID=A0ABT6FID6_9BACT|nr:Zn-dependent dipeptidase, microsomal dipeptidase [Paludisphaera mucosa]MDG3007274.1 Zn-dependent dipeptidase, microsomal dipeptidase [Paludisphaera mucosa]